MKKQSFFTLMSLVFLALAVFFIGSHSISYAADAAEGVAASQYAKAGGEALQKGDTDKAIESFGKAADADPKDAMNYVGLGNAYARKNESEKAADAYNKALSLDPKNVYAHTGLGIYYSHKGDLAAAEKELKALAGADKKLVEPLEQTIQALTPKKAPKK